MTADSASIESQLADLREQLVKLESLRSLLGDKLTDEKIDELKSQIQTLVSTGGGMFVAGSVDVREGDFVGRDKWQVILGDHYEGMPTDKVPPDALLQAYLRSLAAECRRLPLGVVDPRFLQTSAETPSNSKSVR